MYSRFVARRIRPAGRGVRQSTGGLALPERWLLAEWPADESERRTLVFCHARRHA
jgi:hypothetical protein